MDKGIKRTERKEKLAKHLLKIRTSCGIGSTDLAKFIGVSRQTINNIESGRHKMTMVQYIAIRSFLNIWIANRDPVDMEAAKLLLTHFVDDDIEDFDWLKEVHHVQ